MHPVRPSLALAAGIALVLSPVAQAAAKKPVKKPVVKPVCNLITDTTQDTFAVRSQDSVGKYGPQEDVLDITSMDVASDAKTLTAVVRVVKLATKAQTAPGGTDYRVAFTLPGQDPAAESFFMNAHTDPQGAPSFLLGLRTVVAQGQATTKKLADGVGTFDLAKNEVRWSVPVSAVSSGSATMTKNSVLSFDGLDETAARQVAVNPATGIGTALFADVTTSGGIYKAGTKSCVIPGK